MVRGRQELSLPTSYKRDMFGCRRTNRRSPTTAECDNSAAGRTLSPLRCNTHGWSFEVLLSNHLNFDLLPEDFEILPRAGAEKHRPGWKEGSELK